MDKQLYQITCDPECGFMVRSHDKDETKRLAKDHVKNIHGKTATDEETEKMVMEV